DLGRSFNGLPGPGPPLDLGQTSALPPAPPPPTERGTGKDGFPAPPEGTRGPTPAGPPAAPAAAPNPVLTPSTPGPGLDNHRYICSGWFGGLAVSTLRHGARNLGLDWLSHLWRPVSIPGSSMVL